MLRTKYGVLWGVIKVGNLDKMGDGNFGFFVVFHLMHCFICSCGLGGFASVGSRNALHVVGVTPVLHVVRSCALL